MSRELLYKELGKYDKQLDNNTIDRAGLLEEMRATCFAEPQLGGDMFLEAIRSYDPKFGPISNGAESRKRAEISRKAQDGVLKQALIERDRTMGVVVPEGKTIQRAHYVLFQDIPREQKEDVMNILVGGDKQALGNLIYERLAPQRDGLFSLLSMNDEELVNNHFQYATAIAMIAELHTLRNLSTFTEEQDLVIRELIDNMARFTALDRRVDIIANPYYSKYPIEDIQMPLEQTVELESVLANYATMAGEEVGDDSTSKYLRGPTHMLGRDYYGMRTYAAGALSAELERYLSPFGKKPGEVLWGDSVGELKDDDKVSALLFNREPIFVSVPGGGAKALYNTAAYPWDCKLEEVSDKLLNQYMQDVAQRAREQAQKANPFYLSMFSGSSQYNAMEKYMREAEQAQKVLGNMEFPLNRENKEVQKAIQSITMLEKAREEYLKHKADQGLERDSEGKLIGRTENEVNRLAAADRAEKMCKILKFQLEHQLRPESTQERLEKADQELKEQKRLAEEKKREAEAQNQKKTTATEVINDLPEEEKIKGTKEQMVANNVYKTMAPCKASDAGNVAEKMRKEAESAVGVLAGRAAQNLVMDNARQNDMRLMMAQLVLFDYVLRERAANNAPNAENITAGPLEKALNTNGTGTLTVAGTLARSKEFKDAIGTVTPARIEAFLNNKEAREPKFNDVVKMGLAKPEDKVAVNQTEQVQQAAPANVVNAPKPPEAPQAPMPGGGR